VKYPASGIVCLLALVALATLAARQWVELQQSENVQREETQLILVSTAQTFRVSQALRRAELASNQVASGTLVATAEAMTSLGMLLLAREIDVSSLNANAFSALCTLVENVELAFPSHESAAQAMSNQLIRRKLSELHAPVLNEFSTRVLRVGGVSAQMCELKGAKNPRSQVP